MAVQRQQGYWSHEHARWVVPDGLRTARVYLGCDHAGFELKERLVGWLREHGYEPVDCGAHIYDPDDDYPTFVLRAAIEVAADPQAYGVVIGGSGNGEAIAANKVPGIRAALVWSTEIARLAREHNDANVISIGARMHTADEAIGFVETFIATTFSAEARHVRRLAEIGAYERSRTRA